MFLGKSAFGQLGLGDKENRSEPTVVEFFNNKKVKLVTAGAYQTFIALEDNRVFGFGFREYLGCGTKSNQYSPIEVVALRGLNVKKIESDCHTFVLTHDGKLYRFGSML